MGQFNNLGLRYLAIAIVPLLPFSAMADEVADFYKGKTLTMVISSGVGGGI